MILPIVLLFYGIIWLVSAFILTLGIFLVGKISGWRSETGFWAPFPQALLATFIITLVDVGLKFIPIPLIPWIIRAVVWCLVIMKIFDIDFWEAILLAVILFFIRLVIFTIILTQFITIPYPLFIH